MAAEQSRASSATTPDLVVLRDPDSEPAQAYRSVRETLRHAGDDESPVRSILLADAGSRDASGVAAANIAASFALNGEPTVLVDLDAANPVIPGLFIAPNSPGLIDWLAESSESGTGPPDIMSTGIENLAILPAGVRSESSSRAALADLLNDRRCRTLIDTLSANSRIIFHGTVAPVSSQALTVAASVDAVVLLVRSGVTKRTDAQRAKGSFQRVGANLLGVVLTNE